MPLQLKGIKKWNVESKCLVITSQSIRDNNDYVLRHIYYRVYGPNKNSILPSFRKIVFIPHDLNVNSYWLFLSSSHMCLFFTRIICSTVVEYKWFSRLSGMREYMKRMCFSKGFSLFAVSILAIARYWNFVQWFLNNCARLFYVKSFKWDQLLITVKVDLCMKWRIALKGNLSLI